MKQIKSALFLLMLSLTIMSLAACGPPPPGNNGGSALQPETIADTSGAITIKADVWADNWFSFSLGDRLLKEDSVPITTERSFNAESFAFKADYPLVRNLFLDNHLLA